MIISWLTLVPPITVLILSFIFKRILPALGSGIAIAALIVANGNLITAATLLIGKIIKQATDLDNIMMFAFLPILGTIIMLIKYMGGAQALVQLIARRVHTKRGVELATVGVSSLFFMDDYFNSWTVGPIMQSLTDRFNIPRVKLAFYINILAPSLAIIPPISSWIAVVLGQMEPAGISLNPTALVAADPFYLYTQILPFLFYPFIAIALTWFIAAKGISYGPMKREEDTEILPVAKGVNSARPECFAKAKCIEGYERAAGSIGDFVIPISLMMLLTPPLILYTGGYWLFGGTRAIHEALSHANIFKALLLSSSTTLTIITSYYFIIRRLTLSTLAELSREGIELMYQSIVILFLAFVFGDFLRTDLPAGAYLASTGFSNLPLPLLPFIFYVIALFAASTVGSAWGTMMVLIPMAVPMIVTLYHVTTPADPAQLLLLAPTLGAILSGSVVGAHVSPIADNVVVASLATGADHLLHVRTQVPYVIPGVIGAGIAYLILGFAMPLFTTWSWLLALAIGMMSTFGLLLTLNWWYNKKD